MSPHSSLTRRWIRSFVLINCSQHSFSFARLLKAGHAGNGTSRPKRFHHIQNGFYLPHVSHSDFRECLPSPLFNLLPRYAAYCHIAPYTKLAKTGHHLECICSPVALRSARRLPIPLRIQKRIPSTSKTESLPFSNSRLKTTLNHGYGKWILPGFEFFWNLFSGQNQSLNILCPSATLESIGLSQFYSTS